jgi:uncharacterized protein DUF6090
MIKFFRHIRLNLMEAGKTGRYLKYAIGEIILVVIGILIAFQINSWKNDVDTRKLELSTLKELTKTLIQDTVAINSYLIHLAEKKDTTRNLLEHLANKKPYNSNLDHQFMMAYTQYGYSSFNISAFEILKERGLDILSNENLRRDISHHYTIDLGELIKWFQRLERVNMAQTPYVYPLFTVDVPNQDPLEAGWHPNNYDNLIKNPDLVAPFKHFELVTLSYIMRLQDFKEKTTTLLNFIDTEIQ